MYEGATIAVVVPAYNEEGHVGEVIDTMPTFVDRIYVVDDASVDGTWTEIQRHAAMVNDSRSDETDERRVYSPRVVPIRHARNRGVGAAVKTGYERALADDVDVIAVMDGDGQMDPDELDRIVEPVATGEVDYAKGTRLNRREDRLKMSGWRLFGNWVLTMLTRASSGYWQMTDPQNGFRAISKEALATVPFQSAYDSHGFTNDMLALLNSYGFRIADVSHRAEYNDENSDIRYRRFVPELSWLLFQRFLWRLKTSYLVRGFHPLVACYPVGVGATLGGTSAAVYSLWYFSGSGFLGTLSALTVTLLGILLFVLALWFDVQANAGLVVNIDKEEAVSREESPSSAPTDIDVTSDGGWTRDQREPRRSEESG